MYVTHMQTDTAIKHTELTPPEKSAYCTICFERTVLYAHEHGFKVLTSSLGISRWKNMEQITGFGLRAASHYPQVTCRTYNWRKAGGSVRMYKIAKREEFYAQQYCGCTYSLRDSNKWRESQGREKIEIGETWYTQELI